MLMVMQSRREKLHSHGRELAGEEQGTGITQDFERKNSPLQKRAEGKSEGEVKIVHQPIRHCLRTEKCCRKNGIQMGWTERSAKMPGCHS